MREHFSTLTGNKNSKYIKILVAFTLVFALQSCDFLGDLTDPPNDTSVLDGEWFRIESNNPAADNMVIEVENSAGVITDKANATSFNVGDVKWNNITAASDGFFDYEELGSDGNYYSAQMEMADDTTLLLSVGSSGAGNAQKWLKVGSIFTPPPQEAQLIDCSVSSPLVLTNGSAEVDYRVECVVNITSDLTIEPGVVIEFDENSGFGVYDGGTLNMVGTSEDPIVLKGAQNIAGYWRGIHIETRSVSNRIEHAEIRNAGSNYVYCCNDVGSLFLKGGLLAVENVQILDGGGSGLVIKGDAEFGSFSNVTISGQDNYPVVTSTNAVQYIGDTNSDFSGNTNDYIYVTATNLDENVTWKAANVPYLLSGDVLDVTAPLVIEAGTEIAVEENGGIGIYDSGTLKVTGTESSPVIIRGKEALPGYWRGIHMETNSINNDLNYLSIYDAGSNYVYCCNTVASLFFKAGRCAVSNVTIGRSAEFGIYASSSFEFTDFTGVNISSEKEPLSLAIERVDEIEGNSELSGGSGFNYIRIMNSDVNTPVLFRDQNIPYLVTDVIDIKDAMTVESDVEIVFDENTGLGVYDGGSLTIEGTNAENVILSGRQAVQGYWRGIHTQTNTIANSIDYAQILHAGSNYVYCCNTKASLFVKDGLMTVTNSTITDSGGCGIAVNPNGSLTQSGNFFSNNMDGNICE